MLDHAFTDAIDALTESLEKSLLERLTVEEHLNIDVLAGDLVWETSYGLLGETSPAKVRADIGMVWPTWSQSAFRDWYLGDGFSEPPRIELEVTLRVGRLVDRPSAGSLLSTTPSTGPLIGDTRLEKAGPTVEQSYTADLGASESAFEVAYRGEYEMDEATLEDGSRLDSHLEPVGGWIAAALVRLNDLGLDFLPDAD